MTAAPAPPVPLSAAELVLWREYAERRSGMAFDGPRARVLAGAVADRARAGGHATATAYYHHLAARPDAGEWDALFDRLLNGDSTFFRDGPAFAALRRRVLPELRERRRAEGADRLALWSAGCSRGQEAYSLAVACLLDDPHRAWRVRVTGTDVSRACLARAAAGAYRAFEVRSVPAPVLCRYFAPAGADYRVAPAVRAAVEFVEFDLLGPRVGPCRQDVVFCQNVLIYYRADRRAEIVRRLTEALAPGGYLFLGAGEALGVATAGQEPVRLDDACLFRRTDRIHPET